MNLARIEEDVWKWRVGCLFEGEILTVADDFCSRQN